MESEDEPDGRPMYATGCFELDGSCATGEYYRPL